MTASGQTEGEQRLDKIFGVRLAAPRFCSIDSILKGTALAALAVTSRSKPRIARQTRMRRFIVPSPVAFNVANRFGNRQI
jgi:hypothetical protein